MTMGELLYRADEKMKTNREENEGINSKNTVKVVWYPKS